MLFGAFGKVDPRVDFPVVSARGLQCQIFLNTAVLGMQVENGRITGVTTNRGTVYPTLVINAQRWARECR